MSVHANDAVWTHQTLSSVVLLRFYHVMQKFTFAALFLKSLGSTSSCRSTEVSCETTAASTQRCFETWEGVTQPTWVSSSCGASPVETASLQKSQQTRPFINRPISEVSVFLFLCTFGWWHQKPVIEMTKGKGISLFAKKILRWFLIYVNCKHIEWEMETLLRVEWWRYQNIASVIREKKYNKPLISIWIWTFQAVHCQGSYHIVANTAIYWQNLHSFFASATWWKCI